MALESLEALVRSLWQRELDSDLATLSRIPSASMQWFVDHFREMSESDRADVVGVLCKQVTCRLAGLPREDWPASERETAALLRLGEVQRLGRWSHWKYQSVRMLKAYLTETANADQAANRMSESEAERIRAAARSLVTAKAPQLRKAIKAVLHERGYVQTSNRASNWTWSYGGENGFDVRFDFGGMDNQLRYKVGPSRTRKTPLLDRDPMGFEGVLGLKGFCRGDGNWNIIVFEAIDDVSHLVVDLIDQLVSFFEQAESALRAAS